MPTWEEYKATAKSRGALAMELFVIQSTPVAAPEALQAVLPAHLAYQKEIEARGQLFLAGPMSDDTCELMQGIGLIVYKAASLDEAKAIADADPMHSEGVRTYTVRKWLVNEGSMSLSLSLSSHSVSIG